MCGIFSCKIYVFCIIFFHFTPELAGLQLLVPPTKKPELIDLSLSKKEAKFISKSMNKFIQSASNKNKNTGEGKEDLENGIDYTDDESIEQKTITNLTITKYEDSRCSIQGVAKHLVNFGSLYVTHF